MTTQELKQYIDKVLGNSIRCLLPSYWWKRIFGLVVDEVDKVKNSISTLEDGYKALEESKADADAFIMLETTELDRMEYGAVYLVRGQRDSLKVNFWEYKSPRPDVLNWTIWFSNKTSLEVTSNGVAFQWEGGTPTIDLSNLNPNNLYRLDCTLVTVGASGTTVKYVKRVARIVEYGDNAKYDTFVSETSTNAVQNKVITEKFAELSAKIDELGEGVEGPQGPVGPQGPQGNSGYTGAADELEVVNNLTDGGATAALSAEQGKVLDSKLTELSDELASNGQLIEDLQNMKIDRENDDYYPKMAVGLADNLAGVDVVDSEINFRRSGGGAITDGVARIEAIKGNSVVWNQLYEKGYYYTAENTKIAFSENVVNGVTFTLQDDGSIKANGTAKGNAWIYFYIGNTANGHKFLMQGCPVGGSGSTYCLADAGFGRTYVDSGSGVILTVRAINYLGVFIGDGVVAENLVFKPRYIDLTKMFGAGNEPTTIEEFYQRIPMGVDMNAYNEGEVIHMDVQSIESVGVNQWDEEWENGSIDTITGEPYDTSAQLRPKGYIRVIPNAEYYATKTAAKSLYLFYYDREKKYLSYYSLATSGVGGKFTIPQNAYYMRFFNGNTTYNHDICINISDASINGQYFPYIKRQEDLSIVRKYFPDGMKSAGSAHDEICYNKASGKWEKVVRIGEVDMGTLTYHRAEIKNTNETYYVIYTYGLKDIVKLQSYRDIANVLTQGYLAKPTLSLFDYILAEKTIMFYGDGTLYIRDDAYTDVASFKAAMAGVMLYYELAEPIVTELDKEDQFKDLDYQVWNAGTEKANAEGKSAPLAADITYGFNAIGKIKELESLVAALRAKVGI